MSKQHKPVGPASSRVSPPLGSPPPQAPLPPLPGNTVFSTAGQTPVEITDGTPVACRQKNAADFLHGDVGTSVMAHYGQQLFGTCQHTHSRRPAPEEDESGVEELVRWREESIT